MAYVQLTLFKGRSSNAKLLRVVRRRCVEHAQVAGVIEAYAGSTRCHRSSFLLHVSPPEARSGRTHQLRLDPPWAYKGRRWLIECLSFSQTLLDAHGS